MLHVTVCVSFDSTVSEACDQNQNQNQNICKVQVTFRSARCLNFIAVAVCSIITLSRGAWGFQLRLEDVMHLAMPMLVNSTVPAEVDMSIELALMTSEMTSLAFSA